jgi:hypothetical protein
LSRGKKPKWLAPRENTGGVAASSGRRDPNFWKDGGIVITPNKHLRRKYPRNVKAIRIKSASTRAIDGHEEDEYGKPCQCTSGEPYHDDTHTECGRPTTHIVAEGFPVRLCDYCVKEWVESNHKVKSLLGSIF